MISSGTGIVGNGGTGSSVGNIGDVVFAGGNGLAGQGIPTNTGGGGGGSAGILSAGGSATSYFGATAVNGGGAGGDGKDSTGNGIGSQGGSTGGGGGGARGSSVGSQSLGGTGGAGQVVVTVQAVADAVLPPETGPTFASVFGANVNPTNIGSDGLAYLMKYALGGTNTNDKVTLPTVANNGSTLAMTAIVRTNDTNVQILGQYVRELGGTWSNIPTNPFGTASTNTNAVPSGCQRRDFSVESGTQPKTFLRLKATQ